MEKAIASIIIGVVVANLVPKTDSGFKLGLFITAVITIIACIGIDLMLS